MIGGLQGDHFEVERGVHHRIVNVGDGDLTVIEVQTGICNEEDIVRLDDKYGR
jgi:mannose-6-phosphate isomerase-like protein (cupin superfamily)